MATGQASRGLALAAGLAAMIAAAPALAEQRAVVIGTGDYKSLPDAKDTSPTAAAAAFRAQGFRVVEGTDLGIEDLRRALSDLLRPDPSPDRRVVVLMGRFAHSGSETWFLGREANDENLMTVDRVGIPLRQVIEMMRGAPGSVLLLGTNGDSFELGAGLKPGIGGERPSGLGTPGVAVMTGHPLGIGRAAEALAARDMTLARAVRIGPTLRIVHDGTPGGWTKAVGGDAAAGGQASGGQGPVVVPAAGAPVVAPGAAGGQPVVVPASPTRLDDVVQPPPEEMQAWTYAKRTGSAAGYREFLSKYPASIFAGAARGRLAEIEATATAPRQDPAVTAEAALQLGRDERARIQRQLTLLTYDTNGIDGAFGPGTRTAIRAFQRNAGFEATGYLTRPQIEAIARNAAARQRALEAEAERQRALTAAADERLWAEQRGQGEAGARLYLSRFPEGAHAERARQVVGDAVRRQALRDAGQAGRDQASGAEDEAAWARAQSLGGLAAYRAYLDKFPRGRHADEARRVVQQREAQQTADARAEAALDLSPAIIMAVQTRLNTLSLNAGKADGRMGPDSRQALRRYQAARNLRSTGYLNQSTLVRLLADTLVRQD